MSANGKTLSNDKDKKIPPQAESNKLKVPVLSEELSELTSLEVRLLCKRYHFMKTEV